MLDDLGQAVGGDVGVDLGRGDVGVAQQGLDDAKVGAAFQQVGGEGVAQDVGADAGRVDSGRDRGFVQQLGEAARGQVASAAGGGEQPGAVGRLGFAAILALEFGVAGGQPRLDRLAGGEGTAAFAAAAISAYCRAAGRGR